MSISCAHERSLLNHDEIELVSQTHHPSIYNLSVEELEEKRSQLRMMRDKERTLARQKQREVRGKAEPRGGSYPGTASKPQHRKQAFSAALKRINKELKRQRALAAKSQNIEAARRALSLRRNANFVHHPQTDAAPDEGPRVIVSQRRRWKVPPAKIGSISQAVKKAQAIRDDRGQGN
ncbi:MAG: hypothetical protein ACR2PG_02655 [Hyphomicrobiaceae bacterium]